MKIGQQSFSQLCSEISQKTPTPGGGSAAAMAGSLAVALIAKVSEFTLGKKDYQSVERQIEEILKNSPRWQEEFFNLAEKDCQAFEKFSQGAKDQKMIQELILIPLSIARLALKALKTASFLSEKGNQNLVADSRCATELATASFYGALELVRVNLPLVKDEEFEDKVRKEIDQLLDTGQKEVKP